MRAFAARRLIQTLQLLVRDRLVDGMNRATLALHESPDKLARALGKGPKRKGEGGGKRRAPSKNSKKESGRDL